jgi:hypothetical protein
MKIKIKTVSDILSCFILFALILGKSVLPPEDKMENVRAFTRNIEFDYITWTLDAITLKGLQFALGSQRYLSEKQQHQIINDYLAAVKEMESIKDSIENIFSDPGIADKETSAAPLLIRREQVQRILEELGPLSESILQQQINAVLSDLDLTLGGQAIPPVLFNATPLPMALIVSPRDKIRQDANISLLPDRTLEENISLEQQVERSLNVSALVVPIGGVGTYPTMVKRYDHLPWLVDVISHEWVHNYLTLRPLGINYEASPETRTMNETAASLAEGEIREALFKRFYPEFLQGSPVSGNPVANPTTDRPPPAFDFRQEMHQTRLTADQYLFEGKITEAENYMEKQRKIFWENGYQIRRLNQAYFAFYGAYADQPGGQAGTDPVGPAVRALRQQSSSLAEFINRISWMTSFDQLQKAVK